MAKRDPKDAYAARGASRKGSTQEPESVVKSAAINVRKALAGIYLLEGRGSLKTCLIEAGFSPTTARGPKDKGLDAKACLEEAKKLDSKADPANLLSAARKRAAQSIAAIDPLRTPLRDVVRLLDTTEKYFGNHEIPTGSPTLALAERLAGIAALLAVARERGLPTGERSVATRTLDAVMVERNPLETKGESDNR